MWNLRIILSVVLFFNFVFLHSETVVPVIKLEGEITRVSSLPNPQKADYPDCNYTALFHIENVLTPDAGISNEIVLVIPGFRNQKLITDSIYTTGQRLRVVVQLFDKAPEKLRQIQQADEINSLDREYYYYLEGEGIHQFGIKVQSPGLKKTNPGFRTRVETPKPIYPEDKTVRQLRKEAMQKDLASINKWLKQNGGNFRQWYDNLSSTRAKYEECRKQGLERWIGDSYFKATMDSGVDINENWDFNVNFKEVVIQLNQYLKTRNIDLIVLRVPYKNEIEPDLFVPGMKDYILNPYLLKLQRDLLQADVEVVDLARAGIQNRLKYPLMYWYQNKDYHPAEGMDWTAAQALSDRLKRYRFKSNINTALILKKSYLSKEISNNAAMYQWPQGNPRFNPHEPVQFDGVFEEVSNQALRIKEDNNSPVLFIGDSFLGAPSVLLGGSIPQYTAYLSGVAPNWLLRTGGAQGICRFLCQKGDAFLNGRRVCIFCFSPLLLQQKMTSFDYLFQSGQKTLLKKMDGDDRAWVTYLPDTSTTSHFEFNNKDHQKVDIQKYAYTVDKPVGKIFLHLPPGCEQYHQVLISFVLKNKVYFDADLRYGSQKETVLFGPQQAENNYDVIFQVLKDTRDIEITFYLRNNHDPVLIENIEIWGVND